MRTKAFGYLGFLGFSLLIGLMTFSCEKEKANPEEEVESPGESEPIVPKLLALTPDSAVLNALPGTLVASFDVAMAQPEASAFVIGGDCETLPSLTVTVEDTLVKAKLSGGTCANGKKLTVTIDPSSFSSASGVSATGDIINKEYTVRTSGPISNLSSPSQTVLNASATSTLTLTLTPSSSGGTSLTGLLSESGAGITLTTISGNASCAIAVSSIATTGATIALSNCSGDGILTLHVDADVAKDSLDNLSAQSAESAEIVVDNSAPSVSSTKLTQTALGASSLSFSWTAATDTRSTSLTYRIYRSNANPSAGSFISVPNIKNGTLITSGTNLTSSTISSGLTASSSYYFNVIVADEAGNETAYQPVGDLFTAGLKLYYPFNGDSNDITTNANHGARTNSPALVADRFGFASSAYSFVRTSSQHVQSASNIGITGKHDVTFSMWFKGDGSNYNGGDRLLVIGANTNNNLLGFYPSSGTFKVWVNDGSGSDQNTSVACTSTSWQHLVVVYDTSAGGGGTLFYLNGVVQSYTGTHNSLSLVDGPLIIAKAVSNDSWATGTLDDIRVYDTALTASEVGRLYTVSRP